MNKSSKESIENKPWKLIPLTAEYIENEHGVYVREIGEALRNTKIRNIALSGNYGVGKSSILQKVAEMHEDRVVGLSLSALAPIDESDIDDSVPKQATTPTNRIQQEIVKQLLYREKPDKTPGSRFQRIQRFNWARELGAASTVGALVAVVFFLTGWTGKIATELLTVIDFGLWIHVAVFFIATGFILIMRCFLFGRLQIKQLSTGAATVTLDEESVSYFDQYLDEIVYFFEISNRDIVIFEDIDRFGDSQIFETLRALNTLLNSSRKGEKKISFIYAIKDSIFDQQFLEKGEEPYKKNPYRLEDPAQAEAVRANRTKFFDLVIPVVPFITHLSARNLAAQLLKDIDHEINSGLVDLACKYVPDMRLLKNVRNEFIVFRDRIFFGDGEKLKLSQSELFAMMLYKSTHLNDFELIRLGRSNLDELYNVSRKLVIGNIKRIEKEIRDTKYKLSNTELIINKSSVLGNKLIEFVDRTLRAASMHKEHGQYQLNGVAKSESELKSSEFWVELVNSQSEQIFNWGNKPGHRNSQLTFSKSDLADELGIRLDFEYWSKEYRVQLEEIIEQESKDLVFLRGADMSALVNRHEFLVEYGETSESLFKIAHGLLKEGLALQLVRAGYINSNFTLYTSTFHGDRVSTAATNFIIHNVDRGVMDEYFVLENSEVESVVRECGKKALSEPALYNISILDHILRTDIEAADIMINSLVRFGADGLRFLQAYLSSSCEHTAFVARFVAATPKAFQYLVGQAEVEESVRLQLVDAALQGLEDNVDYLIDSAVVEFLEANYAQFQSLTSKSLQEVGAENIAALFSKSSIRVPELGLLSTSLQREFVVRSLYEVNLGNIKTASGSSAALALDDIRKSNQSVYNYLIENLVLYLQAIDGVSVTVGSVADFINVIEDVLAQDVAMVSKVIAGASLDCFVSDIVNVAEESWPSLACYERFPATFHNVKNYVDAFGEIDVGLAKVLCSAGNISELESASEEEKVELANAIILSVEQLPSSSIRATLVASLELEDYLSVDGIPAEEGDFFALLLEKDVVEDDADTYAHLSELSWATRERVIEVSVNFKDYVTPYLLQGDIASFLLSDKVDHSIKIAVVKQADDYIEGASKNDLAHLARFAVANACSLRPVVLGVLAASNVPSSDVVKLLQPLLSMLAKNELFDILQSLGNEYSKLTVFGRDVPKIPNTGENRALLEALKVYGVVSKYIPDAKLISVYKKHKEY